MSKVPKQLELHITTIGLCGLLGFQSGSVPVRFLGVALISAKLLLDRSPLIDKISFKTNNPWASKTLTYTGRLQINHKIHYFQYAGFLDQAFCSPALRQSIRPILQKAVNTHSQQLLRNFLWSGSTKYEHCKSISNPTLHFEESI